MSLGPVFVDLEGCTLTTDERRRLTHPQVGGVILFTRNFESMEQLQSLVREIHAVRLPRLLIGVDHEGGRVQRFRTGFTRLPPAHHLGLCYDTDPARARRLAQAVGWVMGVELRGSGVDFSFAPVLDLYHAANPVIGDRAFHRSPDVVAELAYQVMLGMRRAGMEAVGKHFPGHGTVDVDSHVSLPVDERPLADIISDDLIPFERMIERGIAAIMPAHVIYAQADAVPAGYSPFWLREILRGRLGFQGTVFSDDLSMAAAEIVGDFPARARRALEAGCDAVLVCNHPEGAEAVLLALGDEHSPASQVRLAHMHGRRIESPAPGNGEWVQAVQTVAGLGDSPWMELEV